MDSKKMKKASSTRNLIDISVTKKGGDFKFPWGGGVNIPVGWVAKKATLMSKMIPPWERHLHTPPVNPGEKLVSEIYLLVTKHAPKKEVSLDIHCYEENLQLFDLKVRHKKTGEEEWNDIELSYNDKKRIATIQTDVLGTFAVISVPKSESFEVPMQGLLHNAKINRYISVRFPRKALLETTECEIRIVPTDMRKVEIAKAKYGAECHDLTLVSDFFDIQSKSELFKATRKYISVKLPLLQEGSEYDEGDADTEEIETPHGVDLETFAVMHKTTDGWELVESTYKFTRTTVTFDVKALGRYCMVHHKPERKQRLKLSMPLIENQNEVIHGDILCFIYMEKKLWRLLFEVIDNELKDLIVKERIQTGWKVIEQFREKIDISEQENTGRFRSRRKPQQPTEELKPIKDIDLLNGYAFGTNIKGEMSVPEDTPENRRVITFHEKMSDNFTYFEVVPKEPKLIKSVSFSGDVKNGVVENGEDKENSGENNGVLESISDCPENEDKEDVEKSIPLGFNATFSVYLKNLDSEEMNVRTESLRTFRFDMNDADVREYYRPPTPVISEKPKQAKPVATEVTNVQTPVKKAQTNVPVTYKNFNNPAYSRLTTPSRPPKITSLTTNPRPVVRAPLTTNPRPVVRGSNLYTVSKPVQRVIKESKVLSGKSLQILAKEIEQGLTLAVHLNLPDSCVTGIGFDSLSNGLNLVDVTYKILLFWKRTYKGAKDSQIDDLVGALKEMGRVEVAAILMDRHRQSAELTPGCFSI